MAAAQFRRLRRAAPRARLPAGVRGGPGAGVYRGERVLRSPFSSQGREVFRGPGPASGRPRSQGWGRRPPRTPGRWWPAWLAADPALLGTELRPAAAGKAVCQETDSNPEKRYLKGRGAGSFSRPDFGNSIPASAAGARALESLLVAPTPADERASRSRRTGGRSAAARRRRLRTGLCLGPRGPPAPAAETARSPAHRPRKGGAATPSRTPGNRPISISGASLPRIPGGQAWAGARRRALTRVRVEIEASHVLSGRQRARQARGRQASGRGCAHAVAVHRQARQQRRRGAVHGPRGPEVSAIHPPRECRGQPPRPAGLAQRDLKVRPRRSPRVLGRRGLRCAHGGGGQRVLRSAAGPRPGAHARPAVGPLQAAGQSCARRRSRRLGGRDGPRKKQGRKTKKGRGKKTSFRKSSCRSGSGVRN